MASVVNDPGGKRRIVFNGLDGKRRALYLGKCGKDTANDVRRHVDAILTAAMSLSPLAKDTAKWLGDIPDAMHAKLLKVGLVKERNAQNALTLGPFLDAYLERRNDAKENTRVFYGHTVRNLKKYFKESRPLQDVSPAEADDFRRWLITTEKLSPATVARRCGLCRTFFRDAVRCRQIDANPFEGVGGGPKNNPERSRFIDRATIAKVIDACPNAEWRCLVALSRFGGLRVPSEALLLKWEDINWDRSRMVVHSPKTEHHQGGASRVCPIFPELRTYLDELDALAPEGSVYVLEKLRHLSATRGDWQATNLRTQFTKIIHRAGLTEWPRLWHNLRASRQTELVEEFPAHVVSAWLGNTETVARQHYLMTLDQHFEKAARNTARQEGAGAVVSGREEKEKENEKTPGNQGCSRQSMGVTGLEPVTSTV